MPLGPYKTWGQCEAAMEKKYKSNTKAKKVCGMLEKQSRGKGKTLKANYFGSEKDLETFLDSRKTMEFDQNGELYMKHFIVDDSISANNWGVEPKHVPAIIDNAATGIIGKPVVLYQNTGLEPKEYVPELESYVERVVGEYDHPPMNDNNLAHLLAMQEPYRIGTHKQALQHPNDGSWWALSHITNQGVKNKLAEEPELPFFVSPAIFTLEQKPPYKEWVYLHTAIVDQPAFGVKKANVSAVCTGDSGTCLLHLKKASVNLAAKSGIDLHKGCPFCTYGAMNKIASNIRNEGIEEIAKSHVTGVISSQLTKTASINTDKKVSENPVINQTQADNSQSKNSVESAKQVEAQTLTAEARLMQEIESRQKLEQALKAKDSEIEKLQNDLKVASQFSQDLNKEVKSIRETLESKQKADSRKELTHLFNISKSYSTSSEEHKNKMIDMVLAANWNIDQVKEFLGGPEALVDSLQQSAGPQQQFNNQQQNNPQQGPQPGSNMTTAVASTRNTGTQYGGGGEATKTASVHDSGQLSGADVLSGLTNSYFRSSRRVE